MCHVPKGPSVESQLAYSESQWDIVLACFVLAAFSLLALFVYLLATRSEISPRYRPSGMAGAVIGLIAFLAYVLISASWIAGFDYNPADHTYHPSAAALQFRNSYRYIDWAVTVPLLAVEMAVVSTMVGQKANKTRSRWMLLAFLMIVTGFLGADTFNDDTGRLVWGLISSVLFVPLYVGLLKTGFRSARELGAPAGPHLRRATLMLSWTWGVYPIAYCVPFFFAQSSGWAVGTQLAFTIADIAAKVGYGMFIHATAKARSAIDVAHGESPHPEATYVDGLMVADAQPVLAADRISGEYGHPYAGVNGRQTVGSADNGTHDGAGVQ